MRLLYLIILGVSLWVNIILVYQHKADELLSNTLIWANDTFMLDYIQQRALYEECMELTFHVPAGKPVDRRLLHE